MKADALLQELWKIKDERARRFDGDVRTLSRYLMGRQRMPRPDMPLVTDFAASKAAHAARIAKLPPPLASDLVLPDDPIMAAVRAVREQISRERVTSTSTVREDPPVAGK